VNATTGHSVILNFSTMPQWIFKTDKPVPYPADPEEVTWKYTQGTEFRDPSLKEAADYYGRLVSWYTQGGFTDEYGKRHESGHHYKIDYWEVLNEVESEHRFTPESYTHFYDAIVAAIRKVQPQMKFVAMALERPSMEPQYFEYFLNPKNHKPGTPLDMISYHFYAHPAADQDPELAQYSVFDQADGFFNTVRYVQTMRQGLSPSTMTDLDELGCNPANDNAVPHKPIPNSYWNLCGAVYAYDYGMSARLGVEVAGESQFLGYPSQYPSVSLLDWNTGQPNARFWVLKLLHDNFAPGDKVIQTNLRSAYIFAQAFVTPQGERKLLLINKRNRPFEVSIPEAQSSDVTYVDQTTAFQPPATAQLSEGRLPLSGFEVAVVKLPK